MFDILRNRDFGLLWLSGLIAFIGDSALIIALPLHIYRLTDSTLATAGALAATFLPRVLFGSIVGVFVDRWDRKWTMAASDLTRAIILLAVLLSPDSVGLLYAVAAIRGVAGLFFAPAENALLPTLVGEDRLVAANALNSLNDNLGLLIGPALGALLYAQMGFSGVAVVNSVTFVISAGLISLIAADARPTRATDTAIDATPLKRMVADWRAGLSVVRRDQSLKVLFAASSLAGVAEGVFLTLGLSPLVLDVLGGSPAQVGWLASVQAVGGLIAGLIVVRVGHRMTKRWLVGGGMVGLGLADFSAFNAHRVASLGTPAVGVAMGCMVVAGFPSVAGGAGRLSLIQTQATDVYRGRVFGAFSAAQGAAMLVGFGLGGVLGDSIGLVPVLSASAMLRVLGGLLALTLLPRQESALPSRDASPLRDNMATDAVTADADEISG